MSKQEIAFTIGELVTDERGRWTEGLISPEPIGFTLHADFYRRMSAESWSMHRIAVTVPQSLSAKLIAAILRHICAGHFAPKHRMLQLTFGSDAPPDHATELAKVDALWRSERSFDQIIDAGTRSLIDERLRRIAMIETLGRAFAAS